MWNGWTAPLARLGIARAYALEAKAARGTDADTARSRALAAYRDLLDLWSNADPGVPVYKDAQTEYSAIQ